MKQNADGAWANDACGSSQGVCCIHEVVWGMSNDITSSHERDQVGIHEAMEQQAITKAGVMATSKSLKVRTRGAIRQQHLNMVVPIMARFLSYTPPLQRKMYRGTFCLHISSHLIIRYMASLLPIPRLVI